MGVCIHLDKRVRERVLERLPPGRFYSFANATHRLKREKKKPLFYMQMRSTKHHERCVLIICALCPSVRSEPNWHSPCNLRYPSQ
jgi:hypothetical protein